MTDAVPETLTFSQAEDLTAPPAGSLDICDTTANRNTRFKQLPV